MSGVVTSSAARFRVADAPRASVIERDCHPIELGGESGREPRIVVDADDDLARRELLVAQRLQCRADAGPTFLGVARHHDGDVGRLDVLSLKHGCVSGLVP